VITTEPRIDFGREVMNLLHASDGVALDRCIQCAVCASVCPAAEFMDHSPRKLIALIDGGYRDEVLDSNTFWTCASCFACSERCPEGIHPADLMYALKRYSIWHNRYQEDLVGPDFSRRFVRMIVRNGKSYEPGYAPAFIWEGGFSGMLREVQGAMRLMRRGRLPMIPHRIKRIHNLRRVIGRVMPLEGLE
jgi:heterodisulfide reductase subunit C